MIYDEWHRRAEEIFEQFKIPRYDILPEQKDGMVGVLQGITEEVVAEALKEQKEDFEVMIEDLKEEIRLLKDELQELENEKAKRYN